MPAPRRACALRSRFLRCLCFGLGVAVAAEKVIAQDPDPESSAARAATAVQISEKMRSAMVRVERWTAPPNASPVRQAASSGFFVAQDLPDADWILTILPVWEKSDILRVEFGRSMLEATLLSRDPNTWLSLLQLPKVEGALRLKLAGSAPADSGAGLYVLEASSAVGQPAVAARLACREPFPGGDLAEAFLPRVLRIHAALSPTGGAGAPIFDRQQALAAVVLRPIAGEAEGVHALPVELAGKFLADVRRFHGPVSPWLGIKVDVTSEAPRIAGRAANSPAVDGGLEPGDVVLQLASRRIDSLQDLADACALLEIDEPVEIKVLRGTEIKLLKVRPRLKPSGK